MGEEDTSFAAVMVASVAIILGSKHLVTSMIELLSFTEESTQLLGSSVPVTVVVGVWLMLAAGALLAGLHTGRFAAIVGFAAAAGLAKAWVAPIEPIIMAETAIAIVMILFLLAKDPIPEPERSEVDESTSATRVGSTIR